MSDGVFLDTNILVWLADRRISKLSKNAKYTIQHNRLLYSPMVRLELEYLHEIGKAKHPAAVALEKVVNEVQIAESSTSFRDVCSAACRIGWTRETFDRLIVAEAACHKAKLVTADEKILQHYPLAVW